MQRIGLFVRGCKSFVLKQKPTIDFELVCSTFHQADGRKDCWLRGYAESSVFFPGGCYDMISEVFAKSY